MTGFFDELRRRKVSRTAVVYAVVAWAVIESSSVIFPALHLPEWTVTFIVVLALLGFPVTLVFAWVFDFTREGVVRTPDRADIPPEQAAIGRGRVIDFVIIAVLLGVIGWLGWERMSDRAAYLGWEPGGALPAAGVDPAALMVASATELGDQDKVEMLKPLLEAEVTKFRESGFDPVRIEEFQAILQMITGDPEPFLDGLPRWVRHRWISAYQLETHAFYASVRDEPRFRDMVRQMEERDEAVRTEVGRLSLPD